jgi:hypothetical protein
MPTGINARLAHWRAVLWTPLTRKLAFAYAILGAFTWFRDELLTHTPWASVRHIVDFLPHLTAWQWTAFGAGVTLVTTLEGSYNEHKARLAETAETRHAMDALQKQSEPRPKVVMSNAASGINLRVENLGQEPAANLRVVPVNSKNYRLTSEPIRVLRPGAPEPLVLACGESRPSNPTFGRFSSPTLFFNDLLHFPEPSSMEEAMNAMNTLCTTNVLVTLELAYSNLTGASHYRSKFRVRWDPLSETIRDVEPIEMPTDDNPPPTAPPDVVAPGQA